MLHVGGSAAHSPVATGSYECDDGHRLHPRLQSTIEAIERELTVGPHVYRYRMDDGLDGDEGAFFACSFWLAGNWALQGQTLKAQRRIAELIDCANDVVWVEKIR